MPDPYPLSSLNNKTYFETDYGIIYTYGFDDVSAGISPVLGVYDIRTCFFSFVPDSEPKSDERVAITVEAIIDGFLDNISVLLYVCDSMDNREKYRQALFKRWANKRPDTHLDDMEIEVDNGNGVEVVYGGVLTREDFLYREVLETELVGKAETLLLAKYT